MLRCLDLSPSNAEEMYLKTVLKDDGVAISFFFPFKNPTITPNIDFLF